MSKYLKTNDSFFGCMFNKRGLSDIVNTVLMVVLAIVVIGLLTFFIFNFFNSNTLSLSSIDMTLKKVEAYYNNDPVASQIINANEFMETTYVSVERGSDNVNLKGFKFVFSIGGNSYECIRRNVPKPLEATVYAFKSSIFSVKPDRVEVIPIVDLGKGEKIAKSGFFASDISITGKEFGERYEECGGFCCGANPDLPNNPATP